jgi:hypothetical protein
MERIGPPPLNAGAYQSEKMRILGLVFNAIFIHPIIQNNHLPNTNPANAIIAI